jgi:hypothetical protein
MTLRRNGCACAKPSSASAVKRWLLRRDRQQAIDVPCTRRWEAKTLCGLQAANRGARLKSRRGLPGSTTVLGASRTAIGKGSGHGFEERRGCSHMYLIQRIKDKLERSSWP